MTVWVILRGIPVLQLELSLYFCDRLTKMTDDLSTAKAIASKVEPAKINN